MMVKEGRGRLHEPPGGAPPPDTGALGHSNRLVETLRAEIEAGGGSIGFDRFMELALYAPGMGYYSAGARKLGAAGDFVTAPEISPLFSRCVATQCAAILEGMPDGDILELGAGSGAMAADILMELARIEALPRRYCILEVSADLKERQQQTMAALNPGIAGRVQWLERLPDVPLAGVILANEVVDALPAVRFRVRAGCPHELRVVWQEGGFMDREGDIALGLPPALSALSTAWPEGYTSEYRPLLAAWLQGVAGTLRQGVMLISDYGYPRPEFYHPQRHMGTLLCHYRHRAHDDPYLWPGLQDITGAVDFTALAEAAVDQGLTVRGFTTQAHFLIGCGLERHVAALAGAGVRERAGLARQVQVLTLPGEMGEVVKVMALARDYGAPLAGFTGADHRHRL